MPNSGRMTCISIDTIKEIETPEGTTTLTSSEFMETVGAIQTTFGVQTRGIDSKIGADFTGTVKPSTIVRKWFGTPAFPYRLRRNVVHVAAHQYLADLQSELSKTMFTITTAGTNVDQFMQLLLEIQTGLGVEAMGFDSEIGAVLMGTVKPSTIVRKWFDVIPDEFRWCVEDISMI